MTSAVIVAIIGAIGGIAAGIITGAFVRRRTEAETADKITAAAGGLLDQYRRDNADLRLQVAAHAADLLSLQHEMAQTRVDLSATRVELASTRGELAATRQELASTRHELTSTRQELVTTRGELIEMRKGVRMLIRQIEQLGETPAWQPKTATLPPDGGQNGT